MKRRGIFLTLLCWMLVIVLWAVAGAANRRLFHLRATLQLTQANPAQNMPPLVAFTTVALGGFRGLLVDVLWFRASDLQDNGQYFELVQLADWITKLQPRSANVWAYQAWNMAYNISILMPDPADRWRWIQNGIYLLRAEGMTWNPGSVTLHRELAWIYLHKLSANSDEEQEYYRARFREDMVNIWGDFPRPDLEHLNSSVQEKLAAVQLDPRAMQQVEKETGSPLDWRLPETHAIYWATTGLPYARGDFDQLSLRRLIYQALLLQVQKGDVALISAVFHSMETAQQQVPNEGTAAAIQHFRQLLEDRGLSDQSP